MVVFVLLLTLIVNYFLIETFGFNQETFTLITLILLTFGLGIYLLLSKSLLEPLFKSEENLQKALKETLHELNIPVSTIEMNAKMLQKNVQDEKSKKRLDRILKASQNLLDLYSEMEYSIKKEIDKVDTQTFRLDEVLDESLQKFEDIKGDITIKKEITDSFLEADRNGFIKVLDNIISNAIKYNKPQGVIEITFKNSNLSIYNSGKSIDTKNIMIVFDKYYQENSSNDGFGLGLTIVKEFCDKHNIEIKIDSSSLGTTFILNLDKITTN